MLACLLASSVLFSAGEKVYPTYLKIPLVNFELVSIPAGSFLMGSEDGDDDEKPVRRVSVSGFLMSAMEITQEQYQQVIGRNPSIFKYHNHPVENVDWYDAVIFCNKLSEMAGLEPCYNLATWECNFSKGGFRLPTETEREYACRAGTTTKYYTGESESDLARAGWYEKNSGAKTHRIVGQKEPNSFGLYDMHGNIYEWCNDWFGKEYYQNIKNANNPKGPDSGKVRVLRGGGWRYGTGRARSSNRDYSLPDFKDEDIGFRVVRRLSSPELQSLLNLKGLTMVSIPAGIFQMGTTLIDADWLEPSGPVHKVTVSAFEMSACEITNSLYAAYLNAALADGKITVTSKGVKGASDNYSDQNYLELNDIDCRIDYSGGVFTAQSGYEDHPVVKVTWYGANGFCEYYGFSLPTEAEWEYACRAGTTTRFYTGDSESDLDRAAWFKSNSGDNKTHAVGGKQANAFGLYDMHGNIWEWCKDWFDSNYYRNSPSQDPPGGESGEYRIKRGGGWRGSSTYSRSAARDYGVPGDGYNYVGFRVVRR